MSFYLRDSWAPHSIDELQLTDMTPGPRAGSASTGVFLENLSKLLQVLAIVVGGAWVLMDYFEFQKENKKLTLEQGKLANTTTALNQKSIELNNKLSEININRKIAQIIDVTSESSTVRLEKHNNEQNVYRFDFTVRAKDISDSMTLFIPALVVEFFLGEIPTKSLMTSGTGFLLNAPQSWQTKSIIGDVHWLRLGAYVQRDPRVTDDKLKKLQIPREFHDMAGDFVGTLNPGQTNDWVTTFALMSSDNNMVGAVATFWVENEEGDDSNRQIHTRMAPLSDAEDAPSLTAQ